VPRLNSAWVHSATLLAAGMLFHGRQLLGLGQWTSCTRLLPAIECPFAEMASTSAGRCATTPAAHCRCAWQFSCGHCTTPGCADCWTKHYRSARLLPTQELDRIRLRSQAGTTLLIVFPIDRQANTVAMRWRSSWLEDVCALPRRARAGDGLLQCHVGGKGAADSPAGTSCRGGKTRTISGTGESQLRGY